MARSLLFSFAALLLLLSSCTKSDVLNNQDQIEGSWIVTSIRSDRAYDWDGDGFTETDILSTYSYCERDISLIFEPGGYGRIREGCDAPAEYLDWDLSGNRLYIDYQTGSLDLQLNQLTNRTISGTDQVNVDGRTFNITYTLNRR
ncbi:MAG TPA: hypothetical protein VHK69_00165 [Chitinophagaceae bacterium]|jgi:hypothetical protein|nr:hypothetical protein [Chitinophagaceae bacterium]